MDTSLTAFWQEFSTHFAVSSLIEQFGWVLIIGGLVCSALVRLFQDVLFWAWFAKFVPDEVQARLKSSKPLSNTGKDFLRGTFWVFSSPQNPPDKIFQPMILLITPIALSTVSFVAAGMFITIVPSLQNLFIALIALAAALFCCYRLAVWQIRNNRW